jgi:uncharacterized protein YndB with AHSA1/START domain
MTATAIAHRAEQLGFTVSRTFAAPRESVYRLWTDPAYVALWWGVEGATNPVCELDVQPGGAWHIDMQTASGKVYRNFGTYLEVVPNERLVFTDLRDPEFAGWGPTPPGPGVHTVTFVDDGENTTVTLEVKLQSRPDLDLMLRLGVDRGLAEGFDRFERLLKQIKETEK